MPLKKMESDTKKRNRMIFLFTFLCLFIITFVFLFKSFASPYVELNQNMIHGQIEEAPNLTYFYYVDGILQKDMPLKNEKLKFISDKSYCSKYGKKVDSVSLSFDPLDWQLKINKEQEDHLKCYAYFETME